MNKLVILSGVPGSGKSFFSKKLKEKLKEHIYIVSSDEIRTQICGTQSDLSKDNIMWPMYYELATKYSEDKNGIVVLDSTNTSCYYRTVASKDVASHFDKKYLVSFELNKDVVLKQNKQREFMVPEDILIKIINQFELPNDDDEKYFDEIWMVKSNEIDDIIQEIINS